MMLSDLGDQSASGGIFEKLVPFFQRTTSTQAQ